MRFAMIGLRGVGLLLAAVSASPAASPVAFEKHVLTDKYFCDGINAGDINRDGRPDIVAGPFWYEGPDFQRKHEFYPAVGLGARQEPQQQPVFVGLRLQSRRLARHPGAGPGPPASGLLVREPARRRGALEEALRLRADPGRDSAVCRLESRRPAGTDLPLGEPLGLRRAGLEPSGRALVLPSNHGQGGLRPVLSRNGRGGYQRRWTQRPDPERGLVGTAGHRFEPGGVDGPSVPLRQAGWGPDVRLRRRRRWR